MNCLTITSICLLVSAAADTHPDKPNAKPATLFPGLGKHQHLVSTKNQEAQRFFDQGLTLYFSFNHDEAARSFRKAAELDPGLAMAQWGVALALGPNYNMAEIDAKQAKEAYEALQRAVKLAPKAPEHERAYIEALAKRYSDDPKADGKKLMADFAHAMRDLAKRYPDDLDACTLYAESLMNLRPWKLWSIDGKPSEGTEETVAVLESVLKRNPDHPGANHYYIHAVEASPNPEKALPCADRLRTLVPEAGHMIHMSSHIYYRMGDYAAAARANEKAIALDRAYIKNNNITGFYALMYFSHNMHFLSAARTMQGRFAEAKQAADDLAAHVGPHLKDMPMLDGWMPTPIIVLVRFHRWDDVLNYPQPDATQPITKAVWHCARSLAYAAKNDLPAADKEYQQFVAAKKAISADAMFGDINKAHDVLAVPEHVLPGRIALAKGQKKEAIERLLEGVKAEDSLVYAEPPDGFLRAREVLGNAYLSLEAYEEAEKVFRKDLDLQPRNGRSLAGLVESLKGRKKDVAAQQVQLQLDAAWKDADVKLLVKGEK